MTHILSPILTTRQKNFLNGTILGGSSLIKSSGSRNYYLSMRCKDQPWLEFKASELSILASGSPFTFDTTNRWHSMCYPVFNELHDQFYSENKRKLKVENLEILNDVAFAVWFGDAGQYRDRNIILNTHLWGEDGSGMILEYFDSLGFKGDIVKERGNLRVRLDQEGSLEFFRLAEPHLPVWFLQERFETA